MLVGIEVHLLGQDTELHGREGLGTFRHNHDVGPVLSLDGFPQSACWQQLVVDDLSVIIHEQDAQPRLDISVLIGIIEQDDIHFLVGLVTIQQVVDAPRPLLINGHVDLGILLLDLIRLVTKVTHG